METVPEAREASKGGYIGMPSVRTGDEAVTPICSGRSKKKPYTDEFC